MTPLGTQVPCIRLTRIKFRKHTMYNIDIQYYDVLCHCVIAVKCTVESVLSHYDSVESVLFSWPLAEIPGTIKVVFLIFKLDLHFVRQSRGQLQMSRSTGRLI